MESTDSVGAARRPGHRARSSRAAPVPLLLLALLALLAGSWCRHAAAAGEEAAQQCAAKAGAGEASSCSASAGGAADGGAAGAAAAEQPPGSLTKKEASVLVRRAAKLVPRRPAADRGTYVDFLVFAVDEESLPSDFKDDHFNPVVVVPSPRVVQDLNAELARHRAQFIVSIGDKSRFAFLETLPAIVRGTWFHVAKPGELTKQAVETFFWKAIRHANNGSLPNEPLMSVFTPAYKSREKILIPFYSLRNQTYQNWEWVIYDDSPADHNETWPLLQELAARDYRVRIFRSDRNDGYIGSVKRKACLEATGALLIELDHDDALLPDALQLMREAYLKHPGAGFFYSEAVELYEGVKAYVDYGAFWAFGFGAHFKLLVNGTWMNAGLAPPPNEQTLRHIVGVPNHVRAWSREAYLAIGGHTKGLPVADDYDLVLRAMFKYPSVYVRHMTYLQYRQVDGSTFTFKRNALIQRMAHVVGHKLDRDIHDLLVAKGQPDAGFSAWDQQQLYFLDHSAQPPPMFLEYHRPTDQSPPGRPRVTVVVDTFNDTAALGRAIESVFAQDYDNWELLVVGDKCPLLDAYMEGRVADFAARGRDVRWYNLVTHYGAGGYAPRNYAIKGLVATHWIAQLRDQDEWKPGHLSSLVKLVASDPLVQFAFSSMQVGNKVLPCEEPKAHHVAASNVLYRRDLVWKHGGWQSTEAAGKNNDWDFFQRWILEKWAASMQPTAVVHGLTDAEKDLLLST